MKILEKLILTYLNLRMKNNTNIKTLKKTTANKVLPKAGLNGFDWTFVLGSTFVLRLNFCTKSPRLRQYPKCYLQA